MSRRIFKMSSCGSNAGMETIVTVVNASVNNALFHSNLHISQMLPQIIHTLRFWLVDSLPPVLELQQEAQLMLTNLRDG